jgi:5-methylcytosine-specific restriction endonuclease McrA
LELQFNQYISKKGNPVFIKALDLMLFSRDKNESEERKKTLINLYKPKEHQAPHELLRTMRKEHDLLCCPSCGEDGAPGTLDHYLPKDIFPELAICTANLTPMCNRCQEEKSTGYLTGKGNKSYIHPYFDEINESYFSVVIKKPYSAPSFELKITKGSTSILGLLANHATGINLKERFHKFCKAKHIHLIKLMAKKRRSQQLSSAEKFIRIYLEPELEKSLNSWAAIYYQSVLDTPELLHYLDNEQLPRNM